MATQTIEKNWIPDTDEFAARLALVRWRMGWNLKEASLACGLSVNAWSGWENGHQPRNFLSAIDAIVKRTGVDRMWLMFGDERPLDYGGVVLPLKPKGGLHRPSNRTDPKGPRGRAA